MFYHIINYQYVFVTFMVIIRLALNCQIIYEGHLKKMHRTQYLQNRTPDVR